MGYHAGKLALYTEGRALIEAFFKLNGLRLPRIELGVDLRVGERKVEGLYLPGSIQIWLEKCRVPCSETGWLWSYPGYTVDVTPFGVLAHEAGHHVWANRARLRSGWERVRTTTSKITAYELTDPEEAFAETVRLFITNPDLLRRAFGKRFEFLSVHLKPVRSEPAEMVLNGAPERVLKAAMIKCRSKMGT